MIAALDRPVHTQSHRLDESVFRKWLTDSCKQQGVPVTITDPAIVNQIAVLLKT
ncbi:hypothetical protein P9A14_08325 [Gordonia hongkongensis]|jgi:hypothetical protein|uniref:Uncharacterized protein n=1 Tax=Gordonia hongkongensis TaxID=1701090 RepID=A0AAX3TCI4_9ACTN|nr:MULTISPECIES: hypothetical protein [Gordonia]QIK45797.1 hypothetical protein G8C36_16420 [Gordonia terrae]WFP26483.1 hypothetical protein P9A14_08325 [Gordonia hongkongensis]WGJ87170.1 hypothetical protein QAD21_08700 [Gordonia sp. SMJS1]